MSFLCIVDWVVCDMLAVRQGMLGTLRYVLKDGLRFFPLYGFYLAQVSTDMFVHVFEISIFHKSIKSKTFVEHWQCSI